MRAEVKNRIVVTDATKEYIELVEKELTLNNSEYAKKKHMGFYVGNEPEKIRLYKRTGIDTIEFPFGCLRSLVFKYAEMFDGEIINRTPPFERLHRDLRATKTPYSFQQEAERALEERKNGILVADCGSGKTNIALFFIMNMRIKTLWLTHTKDLLRQSKDRAEDLIEGLEEGDLGTITEGKINVGNFITFATIQTACNIAGLEEMGFQCVIVDECHRAIASNKATRMFSSVIQRINARYKIGLTATPYRADHMEKAMFALIGDIIHTVPKAELANLTCPVNATVYNCTEYEPNDDIYREDGTLDYVKMINSICVNEKRNRFIADRIKGKCVLVLSERISQLKALKELTDAHSPSVLITGSSKKTLREERREAIGRMHSRAIRILYATYQLAKEGLDIPELDTVVFASPIKDKGTVVQAIGRVARKSRGKDHGEAIDFCDTFEPLQRMYLKRRRAMKSVCKSIDFVLLS